MPGSRKSERDPSPSPRGHFHSVSQSSVAPHGYFEAVVAVRDSALAEGECPLGDLFTDARPVGSTVPGMGVSVSVIFLSLVTQGQRTGVWVGPPPPPGSREVGLG